MGEKNERTKDIQTRKDVKEYVLTVFKHVKVCHE